jgi:NDP-sugar pyrophosphorylase family protein
MSETKRKRLTITLRKDILRRIDRTIDGSGIRNRSHAIELLLSKALHPQIKLAIILAGGEGVKMRPVTYEIPKPMIPVKGCPLMEYTVNLLKQAGIQSVLVAIGPKGDTIRNHFGDGDKYGVEIIYSEEKKPLGTAGPLKLATNLLKKEAFFVIYGDILAEIDLSDMVEFHKQHQGLATMALTSVVESQEYGVVQLDGQRVTGFTDSSSFLKDPKARLTNAGIYIFEPEILKLIPPRSKVMLEDIFPKLIKNKELFGYIFSGQWFDITTPKEYERAIKEWERD